MTACTRLLLTGLVLASAAPGPPGDKKDADPARYAARLAAAQEIDAPSKKALALLKIATEAAEDGQDEIVKKCLAVFPKDVDSGTDQLVLTNQVLKLAGTGREAEALEAAKAFKSPYRDSVLAKLADGLAVGVAPFWKACAEGKDDRVEAMLKTDFPKNAKDKEGETGLMKAAARGHVAVVKKLLDHTGVELWEVDGKGQTALMKAADNGQDAVVRLILTYYAGTAYPKDNPVSLADAKGMTALILAADKGHVNVVQTLLDVRYVPATKTLTFGGDGAPLVDLGRKDDEGKTALDHAEANKHAGVVDLLKKAVK
jgi:hypothetical protein